MKQWLPLAACAVVVLVGGFLYFNYQDSSVPAYQEPAKEPPGLGVTGVAKDSKDPFDVTITFTDDGFTPGEITIKKGQRVRFLNESATLEPWPAVGVHPTHTLYPEKEPSDCLGSAFDACKPLKKGEFFDFTFYYTGEWRYHDHAHAYDTGVITVTE